MAQDLMTCPECGLNPAPRDERPAAAELPMRDPETGALNRALLLEAVEPMVSLAHRNARTMAFLHIHVAGLTTRCAGLPPAEGAAVLRNMTSEISGAVRDSDFVARVGPDRFVVALTEIWESDGAVRVANRLVRTLGGGDPEASPFTPRVGVAFYPSDGDNLADLLAESRGAEERVGSGSGIAFADPVLGAEALRRAGLERDLSGGDPNSQFMLHYQPIFSLATGDVVGVESLMRWDHVLQGLLPASDFIPLAERTGRIRALDQWAVTQAIEDSRRWRETGWEGWTSVNLSARTLADPAITTHVEASLARTGMDPESLIFEVTENMALSRDGTAAAVLDSLRALGARIALDDFGTGYASFEYLRDFDPDLIKLDRVFVAGDGNPRDHRLLNSLILMVHHMGKPVVVEGLEQEEQRQRLIDSKCDMVQGYLLGRPMPALDFAELHLGIQPA